MSKRKEHEKALIEQRNTINNVLEGTNSGTWDWNIKTGMVDINDNWAEMTSLIYFFSGYDGTCAI